MEILVEGTAALVGVAVGFGVARLVLVGLLAFTFGGRRL